MREEKMNWQSFAAILAVAVLSACGLPSDAKQSAEAFVREAETKVTAVERKSAEAQEIIESFEAVKQASAKKFGSLPTGEQRTSDLRTCLSGVKALLEANKSADQQKLSQRVGECRQTGDRTERDIDLALTSLKQWQDLVKNGPAKFEKLQGEVTQALAQYERMLGESGTLRVRVASAVESFPNKRSDLEERVSDLGTVQRGLASNIAKVSVEADKLKRGKLADLNQFSESSAAIVLDIATLDSGLQDLTDRLGTLGQTIEFVLIKLERGADGKAYATIAQFIDGKSQGSPNRELLDDAMLFEYWTAGKKMLELFPKSDLFVVERSSSTLDDDQVPTTFVVRASIALDQKFAGQYAEEMSTSPAPQGVPMNMVGNPEYGEWKTNPQSGEKEWNWSSFMVGYWTRSLLAPHPYYGWGYSYGYGWHGGYHDWGYSRGYWQGRRDARGYRQSTYSGYRRGSYRTAARTKATTGRGSASTTRARGSVAPRTSSFKSRVSQKAQTRYQKNSKVFKKRAAVRAKRQAAERAKKQAAAKKKAAAAKRNSVRSTKSRGGSSRGGK